jgi:hypothetical protein
MSKSDQNKTVGILPFSPERKGSRQNLNKGPANNRHAETHGFYRIALTQQESADREEWVSRVIAEKGELSETERTLIETASWLQVKLSRVWKALKEGTNEPASEHVLATVNSLRLLLCALGLEKRKSSAPSLQDYLKRKASRGEQA